MTKEGKWLSDEGFTPSIYDFHQKKDIPVSGEPGYSDGGTLVCKWTKGDLWATTGLNECGRPPGLCAPYPMLPPEPLKNGMKRWTQTRAADFDRMISKHGLDKAMNAAIHRKMLDF